MTILYLFNILLTIFKNLFSVILSDIITILVFLQIFIDSEVNSFFLFNIYDLIIINDSIDKHNDCIDEDFDDDDQVVEIEQEEAADLSGNKDLEENEDADDIKENLDYFTKDNT